MYTDPTEYHRQIEPTQPAYHHNPYEQTSPYGYDEIPIPPPPPAQKPRRTWVIVVGVGICLAVILGGVFFAVFHAGAAQPAAHVTSAPATHVTPTPKALPTLTATSLYHTFRSHGLAKPDGVENDSEYHAEGINPENGVVDFTDYASGQPYTVAVFATSTEVSQAATILFNGGDNVYMADGRCMLHVNEAAHASDFALKGYTSIMDTMCKPS